ncbi:MAG TPA: tetratricopeptide repeat protein [Terriglobales bacterium]
MALGFGFNKAKVLAAAEKFVQQGKLPNAIAEYEKIVKEDPKDLTVLNTLGDLCARVGQSEHAATYFKTVGDQYAQDGFTVKAIAVYKKLTRLTPGDFDDLQKLAELYSQQGLLSDARAQYMQVADHLLKKGDNAQGARVLQKILELDPENAATQSKLADLYTKLGKKDEARNIYYSAAEALHARGSYDAAEEALGKVLSLDPNNPSARLLRGMIAADAGDNLGAIEHLEQVSDIDSRSDALRALLRAKLQSGKTEGVEGLASKLIAVHNDISGISALAQWQIANQQITDALNLFDGNADRFMAADSAGFQELLHPLIGRIRENPEALGTMLRLLQRTGDTSHSAEIIELQAHACAQKGEFREARDLYHQLSELEPENSLHVQNYKQMLSKLGEDPATRTLSAEQSSQAFMVEELEQGAAVVHQSYDPPTEKAIEAALTDAELFTSYNVFNKAIPPLEAALPLAPHDIMLNQRLAALYVRGARFADAARRCQVLSEIYRELGHEAEAVRYTEAANNYLLRVPGGITISAPPPPPVAVAPVSIEAAVVPELPAEPETPSSVGAAAAATVQEFSFDVPDHLLSDADVAATTVMPAEIPALSLSSVMPADPVEVASEPTAPPPSLAPTPAIEPVAKEATPPELDTSSEWESMLSVEPAPAEGMEAVAIRDEAAQPATVAEAEESGGTPVCYAPAERIQEIKFFIAQEMWDEAKKAVLDLTEIAPEAPEITELIATISAGQKRSAAKAAVAAEPEPASPPPPPLIPTPPIEPVAEEPQEFMITPESAPEPAPEPVAEIAPPEPVVLEPAGMPEPEVATVLEIVDVPVVDMPPPLLAPAPSNVDGVEQHAVDDILAMTPELPQAASAVATAPHVLTTKPDRPALAGVPRESEMLEDVLDVGPPPPWPRAAPTPVAPRAAASVAKDSPRKEKTTEDILTDFVVDLEKTELKEFVPRAKPEPVPPSRVVLPSLPAAPAPAAAAYIAASATAGTPVLEASVNGDMRDEESASVLSDILSELQSELAEETVEADAEDPETHYNLGIAFKEMGLLDEAIGELQKVCHAIDAGNAFSQPIQAYTWLAQCLVDKGAPEAAVRWYQRALHLPGLDDGSRCAIYYDLALAFEASGDKKSALANLMEVYGSNIDFRDVASRIKALKS